MSLIFCLNDYVEVFELSVAKIAVMVTIDNRGLCRNYELTFDSAEEMVKIAAIRLLLKKI